MNRTENIITIQNKTKRNKIKTKQNECSERKSWQTNTYKGSRICQEIRIDKREVLECFIVNVHDDHTVSGSKFHVVPREKFVKVFCFLRVMLELGEIKSD